MTYIPEVGPQIKRALAKAGVNTVFKAAPKLGDILCGKNKTRPPQQKRKGIYKYKCPCSEKAIYIGQTARWYEKRWAEHQKAVENKQWSHSGISQHHEHCTLKPEIENFESIQNMQGKRKNKLAYDMRVREALEIRRHGCGPGRGLNEDMGAYIKTDIWDPVLNSIT